MLKFSFLIFVFLAVEQSYSLDNGVARTPPMGWLSWERFTCNIDCVNYPHNCINEQLYKDMADRMVEDGFKDVGYQYINIDDCWSEMERDSQNKLVADKKRFPSGIKALADYMHSKGLKLGIYGDVGYKTCAGYPSQNGNGSGYFDIDAKTFAEWGIDSFKFDGCNLDPKLFDKYYPIMQKALNATGAPILFSCEWPFYQYYNKTAINYDAVVKTCNLFRNFDDIGDGWSQVQTIIDFYHNNQDLYVKYNGPGQWFDPDALIIGDFGLSYAQSRAQFALWSIWSSPLYMSNDLRRLDPAFKKILQNKKIIAVNQDPMGAFGRRVLWQNWIEVWVKPLQPQNNTQSYAVVYLNRNGMGDYVKFDCPMSTIVPSTASATTFTIHDLFEDEGKEIIGTVNYHKNLTLLVSPGGGVRMVKLVPN